METENQRWGFKDQPAADSFIFAFGLSVSMFQAERYVSWSISFPLLRFRVLIAHI